MRYKNIKTGSVIETSTNVHGGDWREIPATTPDIQVAPVQQKKKGDKNEKLRNH